MATRRYKILLVEDDEDDYILTRGLLKEAQGWEYELYWVPTFAEALANLKGFQPDVMLVDYDLGSHTGLDVVRAAAELNQNIPAVMLTGRGNLDVDLQAMQAGAIDYLVKGEVSAPMLERSLRYAIEQQQVKNDLRQARDELELRVQERTRELQVANHELEGEIAERKRMAAELAEVQRRLIDSSEAERLQFAQELHDGPMQDIYSVIFQLEMVKNRVAEDDLKSMVGEVQKILQQVNQVLRATAGELRPPALAPYGLEKAFRSHAEAFCQAHPNLEVHLHLDSDRQLLPERVRLAMFRIYQMGMSNILRHAQATQVDIRFLLDDQTATLELKDNGRGFKLPDNWIALARSGHLGLVGARERAAAVGGTLNVITNPGSGTLLRVVIPLNTQDAQPQSPDPL